MNISSHSNDASIGNDRSTNDGGSSILNDRLQATLASIAAMRHQENTYRTTYYLQQHQHQHQHHPQQQQQDHHVAEPSSSSDPGAAPPPRQLPVTPECRKKLVAWCYHIVDFCQFQRETVAITMNLLDRYLATPEGAVTALASRKHFQLSAMTCLYTAVKIHEPASLSPVICSSLSRGVYTPDDFVRQERDILQALRWRVNPPTPMSFMRYFVQLFPNTVLDESNREAAYELVRDQMELAVEEYTFLSCKPSVLAYCALLNAVQTLGVPLAAVEYMATVLSRAVGMDQYSQHAVLAVQEALYKLVQGQLPQDEDDQGDDNDKDISSTTSGSNRARTGSSSSVSSSNSSGGSNVGQPEKGAHDDNEEQKTTRHSFHGSPRSTIVSP